MGRGGAQCREGGGDLVASAAQEWAKQQQTEVPAPMILHVLGTSTMQVASGDSANGKTLPMNFMSSDILLSISPAYAAMILSGVKTVELRRRFSKGVTLGTRAVIYSTAPDKCICGLATISDIETRSLDELWRATGRRARVSRQFFNSYFNGLDKGYAVHLEKPRQLQSKLTLDELRESCDFVAPQSYRYLGDLSSSLLNRIVPHLLTRHEHFHSSRGQSRGTSQISTTSEQIGATRSSPLRA